jgi:hypothetical protein
VSAEVVPPALNMLLGLAGLGLNGTTAEPVRTGHPMGPDGAGLNPAGRSSAGASGIPAPPTGDIGFKVASLAAIGEKVPCEPYHTAPIVLALDCFLVRTNWRHKMKTEVQTSLLGEAWAHLEASKAVAQVGRNATRGCSTEVTVSDFGDVGKRITLVGRLDILGSEEIDLPLAVVAGSGSSIVIDLSGVDFPEFRA